MNIWNEASRASWLAFLGRVYPWIALGLLVMACVAAVGIWLARRRSRQLRRTAFRCLLLGLASLLGFLLAELTALGFLMWAHRAPGLAMVQAPAHGATGDDVNVLVVGESSAEGVPYRDWVSVGRIVVWQLRRLFPGRMFHLEVQARAGWTLEQMHQRLAETRRRPDAVLLYAGHNEFASRYGWSTEVPYYRDDLQPTTAVRLARFLSRRSPLCRLMRESREQALVAARPTSQRGSLVDVPSCTVDEYRERITDFRRRLEIILADLKRAGVLTIVVIPPGNDAGFEPNRSILPPDTPRPQREAFARELRDVRSLEPTDPRTAEARYRDLIDRYPGFAETHFRLARLLEGRGACDEAYSEYVRARDLDAHPMRCPTGLQEVYREVAPRYGAVLVDGQDSFHKHHVCGQLNDELFNDAMHPSLAGQVVLARAVLEKLRSSGSFGWPESLSVPDLTVAECAEHFDVTLATWKEVCKFAAGFYRTTLLIRFDPAEREVKARRYEKALELLEKASDPGPIEVPGVGLGKETSREARLSQRPFSVR
jgi:lysophospholipase L1-like esterase